MSGRRARAVLLPFGIRGWQDRPLLAVVVVRVHGQVLPLRTARGGA
jgi:hypothetical protein